MRPRAQSSLAGSPVLIGAVTTLVCAVAVFLSYNANQGLPFVPTYKISVEVQDAAGLVKGNEVRIGGKRVGSIEKIDGKVGASGPHARLDLKLDKPVEPLLDDTQVTVRPRSTLGLKYLEVVPGKRGDPLEPGETLALERSVQTVELDEVFDTFDEATRKSLQRTITGLGTGLAGRGVAFNESVALSPELAGLAERVFANVADPATRLRRAVQALERVTDELAPVAPRAGDLFDNANTTLGALAGVRSQLSEALAELPPTEAAGIEALRVARPLLAEARLLVRELRPGLRALPTASRRLHSALDRGIPVLRRASALADRLEEALAAVEDLAADPLTRDALTRLRTALDTGLPNLRYLVPMQADCNYLGLWLRNAGSTISEGDIGGTWVRTLVLVQQDEMFASDKPAPNLHHNAYPNVAAPGTQGECEAGNEPVVPGPVPGMPGQKIGNPPGVQATRTEDTNRNQGILGGSR
jgi:virulence factor Mce-like protein